MLGVGHYSGVEEIPDFRNGVATVIKHNVVGA